MKYSSRGLFGTIVIHSLVLMLLIFFGFSYPDPPPPEQGILINFGTDETGFGDIEPAGDKEQGGNKDASPKVSKPEPVIREDVVKIKVKETVKKKPADNVVQNYEESPVKVKSPTPEDLKQLEIERQKQEELKIQKAEEARKQQVAEQWNNKGQAAFGKKGVGTTPGSQGITQGTGNQGNPNGTPGADNYGDGVGLGNGNSYDLGNRTGDIPRPVDKCVVTSRVIVKVKIIVDREGNVVGVPEVIESTYEDPCIYKAIIQAASKAKFNTDQKAPLKQLGWIRYIYEP